MATALTLASKFIAVDKFTAPVRQMGSATRKFAKQASVSFAKVERVTRKMNNSINNVAKSIGGVVGIAGGLALGVGISSGADAVVDFDKSLTAAAAKFEIFDRLDKNFIAITKAAKEVGATTEFTGAQAAKGLNFLALAGFKAESAIAALPTVVNLATSAEIDLGLATDIATDTLGAMGLASKNTAQNQKNLVMVSNILAKTTTSSNTTMEQLFETIQDAGPAFTKAGGKMHEFAAIAGIMANAGIKSTKAGTAIKNMVLRLQAPTAAVSSILAKMNVNIDDGTGKMKSMADILGEMMSNTQDWTQIQRNAAFSTIFGKQAISGSLIAMEAGSKGISEYAMEIKAATNASADMANFMRKSLSGSIDSVKSAFESIALAIGETFRPEINAAVKELTLIARGAKIWFENNKPLIKTIFSIALFTAKLVIAIKAVTLAFAIWNTAVKVATAVQWAWNAAMTANPIGIIIVAIAAMVAGIALAIKHWDDWGAALTVFMGPIGMVIAGIQAFRKNWEMIKRSLKDGGILAGLKAIGATIIETFLAPIQQLFKLLSKLPVIGDKFAAGAARMQAFRENLGVNTTTSASGELLNPDATIEKVRTERSEKTINNNLSIDINDKSGMASVGPNPSGIPVNLTTTLGWQ